MMWLQTTAYFCDFAGLQHLYFRPHEQRSDRRLHQLSHFSRSRQNQVRCAKEVVNSLRLLGPWHPPNVGRVESRENLHFRLRT